MGAALATIAAMTATAAAAQDAVREDRAPAPYVGPAEQTAQPPMQPIPNCPVPSGPCLTASTRWNGAVETREEDRRFHVNGRFMYDIAYTDAECINAACTGTYESGVRTYARRAFIGVDGRLSEQWRYNVKFDFTFGSGSGSTPNSATPNANQAVQIKADDLFREFAPNADSTVFIGITNAVSPMEDRGSSLTTAFNERSFMITAGGFGKRPGIAYSRNGGNWSMGVGVQSNDGPEKADNAALGTESGFVIARGTWAPIYQRTPEGLHLLHLGGTARYRDAGNFAGGGRTALSYSPGALSNKASNNAGTASFGQDTFYGGEVVFQHNAFGAAAEYGKFKTGRGIEADASGYYIDLFWSPTGESRNYNAADGSFRNVVPSRTWGSDGGFGHIMLAARYESLDLTDPLFGANRNTTTAWTAGVTLIPIDHVKFQLNVSSTDVDYTVNTVSRKDNKINAVTLRSQFDW